MRKLIIAILLFVSFRMAAQTYTPVIGRWDYQWLKVDSGYRGPLDTLASAPIGATAVKGSTLYVKLSTGYWQAITGAGGSGVWGFISGTLSAQSDLATKFGTKYDTTVRKMDTLYAITDSTYGFYINGIFHSFKARGSVPSFMGRSGQIALTQQDVDSALGYVPSQLPNVANSLQVINNGNTKSWQTGLYSARPAAGNFGSYYTATDSLAIYFDNGISWISISKSAVSVPSVFGRTGAVVADSGDYNQSQVGLANVLDSAQIVNTLGTPSASSDIFANRPAAGTAGRLFVSTDTKEIYRDNGTSWDKVGSGASGGVTTYAALTDVNLTSLINGQIAQYNSGTGRWVNITPTNALVGLSNVPNVDATNAANISTGTLPAARIGTGSIDLTTKVTGLLPDGNISSAATWNAKYGPADTAGTISTRAYRQKLADSLGAIIATKQAAGTYYGPADTAGNISTRAYRQKGLDSLNAVLNAALALKKNLSDSNANSPGAYTTQASRQKLSDSLQILIALKLSKYDTAAGPNEAYVTWASRQKLADSLVGLINLRRLISDTGSINSPATRGWLYKVADSLAALIGGGGVAPANPTGTIGLTAVNGTSANFMRADAAPPLGTQPASTIIGNNTGSTATPGYLTTAQVLTMLNAITNFHGVNFMGYDLYANRPTSGTGFFFAMDSIQTGGWFYINGATATNINPSTTITVRGGGQPGDTTLFSITGSVLAGYIFHVAAVRDSANGCLHHIVNADGSWTFYSSCVANAGNVASLQKGLYSARPAASGNAGACWFATDSAQIACSDGTSWTVLGRASGGGSSGVSDTTVLYTSNYVPAAIQVANRDASSYLATMFSDASTKKKSVVFDHSYVDSSELDIPTTGYLSIGIRGLPGAGISYASKTGAAIKYSGAAFHDIVIDNLTFSAINDTTSIGNNLLFFQSVTASTTIRRVTITKCVFSGGQSILIKGVRGMEVSGTHFFSPLGHDNSTTTTNPAVQFRSIADSTGDMNSGIIIHDCFGDGFSQQNSVAVTTLKTGGRMDGFWYGPCSGCDFHDIITKHYDQEHYVLQPGLFASDTPRTLFHSFDMDGEILPGSKAQGVAITGCVGIRAEHQKLSIKGVVCQGCTVGVQSYWPSWPAYVCRSMDISDITVITSQDTASNPALGVSFTGYSSTIRSKGISITNVHIKIDSVKAKQTIQGVVLANADSSTVANSEVQQSRVTEAGGGIKAFVFSNDTAIAVSNNIPKGCDTAYAVTASTLDSGTITQVSLTYPVQQPLGNIINIPSFQNNFANFGTPGGTASISASADNYPVISSSTINWLNTVTLYPDRPTMLSYWSDTVEFKILGTETSTVSGFGPSIITTSLISQNSAKCYLNTSTTSNGTITIANHTGGTALVTGTGCTNSTGDSIRMVLTMKDSTISLSALNLVTGTSATCSYTYTPSITGNYIPNIGNWGYVIHGNNSYKLLREHIVSSATRFPFVLNAFDSKGVSFGASLFYNGINHYLNRNFPTTTFYSGGGNTSHEFLQLKQEVLSLDPAYFFYGYTSNLLRFGGPMGTLAQAEKDLITTASWFQGTPTKFLVTIFPEDTTATVTGATPVGLTAFKSWMANSANQAAYGFTYVDCWTTLTGGSGNICSGTYMASDHVHLNDAGYAAVEPLIAAAIGSNPTRKTNYRTFSSTILPIGDSLTTTYNVDRRVNSLLMTDSNMNIVPSLVQQNGPNVGVSQSGPFSAAPSSLFTVNGSIGANGSAGGWNIYGRDASLGNGPSFGIYATGVGGGGGRFRLYSTPQANDILQVDSLGRWALGGYLGGPSTFFTMHGYLNFPGSTTTIPSLSIKNGTAPTSGMLAGDFYQDGTHAYVYEGGAFRQLDQQSTGSSGNIWSQTASGTALTNTVTQTSILGTTATGSLTIAANTLAVGKKITMHGYATVSHSSTGGSLLFTGVLGGGGLNLSIGSPTISEVGTTYDITLEYTVTAIGSSGAAYGIIKVLDANTGTTTIAPYGSSTINTTSSIALDLQVTWGVATTSNSIQTLPNFTVKID